jgi:hypothetical protein
LLTSEGDAVKGDEGHTRERKNLVANVNGGVMLAAI